MAVSDPRGLADPRLGIHKTELVEVVIDGFDTFWWCQNVQAE
jgi:hypothetical protein